jgi:hypothetical protein
MLPHPKVMTSNQAIATEFQVQGPLMMPPSQRPPTVTPYAQMTPQCYTRHPATQQMMSQEEVAVMQKPQALRMEMKEMRTPKHKSEIPMSMYSQNFAPETQYPPAPPHQPTMPPDHQMMSAKTDGKTIFVRKTDLLITFHRTRSLHSSAVVHPPPRAKEKMEVYPVAMYPHAFPNKTGVFVPMKAKTSFRICFDTRMKCGRNPYLIRIYAGAVNIISGKMDFEKTDGVEQDYIVVPEQTHINGFAVTSEKALQFTAPEEGVDVALEYPYMQNNGRMDYGTLRFEITPFEFENVGDFFVRANGWMDRKMMLPIQEGEKVRFPARIQRYFHIDSRLVKWSYRGRKYPDGKFVR